MKLNESLVLEKGKKKMGRSQLDHSGRSPEKITSEPLQNKVKKVAVSANPKMNKFIKNQVEKIKNRRREVYEKQ